MSAPDVAKVAEVPRRQKLVIGMAMASTALTTAAMPREGQWYVAERNTDV